MHINYAFRERVADELTKEEVTSRLFERTATDSSNLDQLAFLELNRSEQ